ncbi:outer membrane lipoprotein carrier protein LolA [Natrinema sp. H-ect4]|uniref:LolA family protein n=1 Tax=Natrinema sp. H-ect4 TaxID=3242699 RepID=UPI0035A869F8
MNRRRLLATSAAVALAGCLSDSDDGTPTGADLVRDAIEMRRRMRSLEARRTVSVDASNETVERVEHIARRPPAKQRIEVLESTDSDVPVGSITVTNRATTWEYNPSTEVVDKQYHPNKVDTDQTRLVLENLLEEYRLGYEGTETVDGRTAHVVETKPPVDDIGPKVELVVGDTTYVMPVNIIQDLEQLDVSRTVWIDDEYRYPIKERNTMREDGETRHDLTVTYEDLSIDEGLAPGTFTYEPPNGVTVVTDGREPEGVFEHRGSAEAHLPYELPEPDVPDAYALDRITVIDREDEYGGTTAMLWYNDPNVVARELYVAVREFQRFSPTSPTLEEIEVDSTTAYRRDGRIQSIFWTCDDLSYEVSSLTDDTPLLEIAASIGCS